MKPLKHQEEAIERLTTSPFLILADEAGLGKTFTALQAVKLLEGTVGVFAPKSTLSQWKATAEKLDILDNVKFIATNSYQSASKRLQSCELPPSILILDEAHQGAGDTKFAKAIINYVRGGAGATNVWLLTASPIRDGKIINAWLIYALLKWKNEGKFPNYYEFQRRYGAFNELGFYIGNKNDAVFAANIAPYMLRRTYEDIGKSQNVKFSQYLHKLQSDWVDITLQSYMEEAAQNAVESWCDEEKAPEIHLISILLHLRQKLALAATTKTLELLGNGEKSVLVFSNFCAPLEVLSQNLNAVSHAVVYGDTKEAERKRIFSDFNNRKIKILLTTFGTTSTGVDFPDINHTIFNDMPLESTQLHQAIMRTVRISSRDSVESKLFEFINNATIIDEWVLALLATKVTNLRQFVTVPTLAAIPNSRMSRGAALRLLQEILLN
jgi:superfamily II DNA or RNA helicase